MVKYLFALVSIMQAGLSFGQEKETGFSAGTLYYLGELNQKQFAQPLPAVGFTQRITYQKRIAWEQHVILGRVHGADSLQPDEWQKNRNLNFRSDIIEVGTQLEINYFEIKRKSRLNFASPYVFFGFSVFYSNPQAYYNGEWKDLRNIGTEGQNLEGGKKYNLINFAIPLGVGVKITLGDRLSVNLFSGFRKTFTDYLDDVGGKYADVRRFSTDQATYVDRSLVKQRPDGTNTGLDRGNSNTKDWYNYTGIAICFKTNRKRSACDMANGK